MKMEGRVKKAETDLQMKQIWRRDIKKENTEMRDDVEKSKEMRKTLEQEL